VRVGEVFTPHAKSYEDKSVRLVHSLRKYGGLCSNLPVSVWYGEDAAPSQETIDKLTALGCDVLPGVCEFPDNPLFNKITALGSPFEEPYGMWMDSDIFVRGDITPIISTGSDVAAPDNYNSFHKWAALADEPRWRAYYDLFGVPGTVVKMSYGLDGGLGNLYLNSGIVFFRNSIEFPQKYRAAALKILASGLPDCRMNFTQTALTMAVISEGLSYSIIPECFHSCYALRGHQLMPDTVISHYQDSRVSEISDEDWNV
jgi:hypothetical protein